MDEIYDFLSLGMGSAGMAGAVYAARFNLRTCVIGLETGGLLNEASRVENYPGFVSIPGIDLMFKFREHVESLGVTLVEDEITGVNRKDNVFETTTRSNGIIKSRTILFALGSTRRKLNVPGEKELVGKGVAYCATCDAPFFRGKTVGVVGGGDAAAQAALLLAEYAKKVYIIYRREQIRAEPIYRSRLGKCANVEIIPNANVLEILGTKVIEKVILDREVNGSREFFLEGLFIEIGNVPNNALALQLGLDMDKRGLIMINRKSETSIRGVFAAGDLADGVMKQAITGVAEGCIAAQSAFELLR